MEKFNFDNIHKLYRQYVYNVAYGILKNKQDAEDTTQDTFIKVFNALEKGKKPKNVKSWIHVIAKNMAIDNKKARPDTLEFMEEIYDSHDTDIIDEMDNQHLFTTSRELVEQLGQIYVDVFDLYYTENYTIGDVAERLGIERATASMRLSKIVRTLGAEFTE